MPRTSELDFTDFLSAVAGRLRHDLKGGLITLRMGLEALPDEEDLKPLLVQRALDLESLSDKLVLLLRMGSLRPEPVRLSALLGEFRARLADRFPQLELELPQDLAGLRYPLDSDALLYALLELAENATLAGARRLQVGLTLEQDDLQLSLTDDGAGPSAEDSATDLKESWLPLGVSRWGRGGLGLAIAERCAIGHSGGLTLQRANHQSGLEARLTLRSATS